MPDANLSPTPPVESFRNRKIPIKKPNTWKNNKLLSIVVTLILMLLLFGSAAYVAYRSERQIQLQKYYDVEPEATIVPPKEIYVESSPTPVKPIDKVENWKTFKNNIYGITFKYPENYKAANLTANQTYGGNVLIAQFQTADNKMLKISYDKSTVFSPDNLQKYASTGNENIPPEQHTYANNIFYYYGPGGGGVCYPDQFFFNLSGKVLIFEFSGCENGKQPPESTKTIEKDILSTFQLINK